MANTVIFRVGYPIYVSNRVFSIDVYNKHGQAYILQNIRLVGDVTGENNLLLYFQVVCDHCQRFEQEISFIVSHNHIEMDRQLYGNKNCIYTYSQALVMTSSLYDSTELWRYIRLQKFMGQEKITDPNLLFRVLKKGI
jgi:hypothetical protein